MISHEYKCTCCKRIKKLDFDNMADRDSQEKNGIPCIRMKCKGNLLRYWGGGKAPAVNTTTSPARAGRGRG